MIGTHSLTLAQITGDWQPEIVGNSAGFSAYTRADSGWARHLAGNDNFSGFASFEDASPFERVGLYTNLSFGVGSAPVLGGVFPDASPQFRWRPTVFVLGSSNWTLGEWPGRFSHASTSMGQNNEVYPPAVYVPVLGNPGRVYVCDLWSIPGNGTPASAMPFVTAPNATATANGFFNGDFRPDVAVACAGTGPGSAVVSVLLHTAPTAFAPRVDYSVADGPVDIVAGAFGGPRSDLAVACAGGNGISYLRNNGDGTFAPAVFLASSGHSGMRSIHAEDINQDGERDLVVFYSTSTLDGTPGGVGVRFGAGNQEFGPEHFTPIGAGLRDGAVADMNGDGFPDAVVSVPNGALGDRVEILPGRGDGTFGGGLETNATTMLLPQPHQMALGDFDGDLSAGGPTDDIVIGVPSASPNPNLVLLPSIPGANPAPVTSRFDNGFLGVATGHFFDSADSPRPLDLLLGSIPPLAVPGVHAPLGFGVPVELGCDFNEDFNGPPLAVDLDGDGFDDAVTAMHVAPNASNPGKLEWCLNHGDGTFAPFQSVVTAPDPRQALAADFDGDGLVDVVTLGAPNTLTYHANLGAGVLGVGTNTTLPFTIPATGSLGPNYYAPTHVAAVARLAGPASPLRLLVLESNPPRVAMLAFNGAGGFTFVTQFATAANPIAVAAGDLDGDGEVDLVVACEGFVSPDSQRERLLTVWYNDGQGGFPRRTDYTLDSDGLMDMQLGDLTGDGTTSVAILSWGGPRSMPQFALEGTLQAQASGGVRLGSLASFEPASAPVLAAPPSAGTFEGSRLAIRPNPARARATMQFAITRPGEVQAEAFDLSGRRVWASPRLAHAAGPVVVEWKGDTQDGSRLNAGLYLVRVTTPDGSRSGRVVWLH